MKTKIIIFLILISNSLAYSQIIKSIGLKGGVTFSKQYWDNSLLNFDYKFNAQSGLYIAITTDIISKEYWDISADLGIYNSKSQTERNPFSLYTHDLPPNMHYDFGFITFSPYVKLKIPYKAFTLYGLIGPSIDYYFSKISNDEANYYKNVIKKPTYGFNVGEGISFNIKRISIFAEYQYFYRFKYLIDELAQSPILEATRDRLKINTHVISLGLKYHFNKG